MAGFSSRPCYCSVKFSILPAFWLVQFFSSHLDRLVIIDTSISEAVPWEDDKAAKRWWRLPSAGGVTGCLWARWRGRCPEQQHGSFS
jgi:hypothetical protein